MPIHTDRSSHVRTASDGRLNTKIIEIQFQIEHYDCLTVTPISCFRPPIVTWIHLSLPLSLSLIHGPFYITFFPGGPRASDCISLSHLFHHSICSPPQPLCIRCSLLIFLFYNLSPSPPPVSVSLVSTSTSQCQTVVEWEHCRLQAVGVPGSR